MLVFLPVKLAMRMAPSIFPLDISVSDPFTEIPADMLLFQICIPFAIEHFKLRTTIKSLLRYWFTAVGWSLGLTDFLLPRPEDNNGQESGNGEPARQDRLLVQLAGQVRALGGLVAPDDLNRGRHTTANTNLAEEDDGDEQSDSDRLPDRFQDVSQELEIQRPAARQRTSLIEEDAYGSFPQRSQLRWAGYSPSRISARVSTLTTTTTEPATSDGKIRWENRIAGSNPPEDPILASRFCGFGREMGVEESGERGGGDDGVVIDIVGEVGTDLGDVGGGNREAVEDGEDEGCGATEAIGDYDVVFDEDIVTVIPDD
ncbi:putative E3 ubiquitin ligase SUD1 [Camellia lanceoleosa]|uniref:E3 ubiquitin ligase SUD1 n=1 Tax=Camellia lanceoleosa TaxID=1840588 RepID=A0ACC0FNW2_9ERIC|nr:putative E3 ubiquitin ligase SUD1 [Camellia lanceoleosa]